MAPRKPKRAVGSVTSVDVAREAGVSQATVARVFSSPHVVSDATRTKVEQVAERIGYVPNAIARSLKSQRTNIIGAVVPAHGEYWQNVLTELSQHLAELDRQLLLFSFDDGDQVDRVLDSVRQYRVDGLVLASSRIGLDQLSAMADSELPVVAFNQPAAGRVVDSVSVDNAEGMAMVAEHLVATGVESVLFVGGVSGTSTDQLRYQGAARALGHHGIACPYLEAGAYTYDAGYEIVTTILDRPELPGAVMVSSDEVALGVLDGLANAELDVPGDVAVTGFDGLPQAGWAGFDLTTLVQPIEELVRRAAELLFETSNGRPTEVVAAGTLRLGSTTASTGRNPSNSPPSQEEKHG